MKLSKSNLEKQHSTAVFDYGFYFLCSRGYEEQILKGFVLV